MAIGESELLEHPRFGKTSLPNQSTAISMAKGPNIHLTHVYVASLNQQTFGLY
jgi:hypothetical protein